MRNNRPWLWGVLGAVLAVGGTLGLVRLADSDRDPTTVTGDPTGSPTSASPSDPGSSSPSPPETGSTFTVAAYFVGETGRGPRLFREFSKSNATDVGRAAVQAVLNGPTDPDYASPWSEVEVDVSSVTGDEGLVTVDLAVPDLAELARPASMSDAEAGMAIEQLVRTAQGALQVGRAPVQIQVDGQPVSEIFGVAVGEALAAASDDDVLAHVWVNTPVDGATVSPGDVVEGIANSFEATVIWQLRQGDTVVEQGFTTASEAFTWAPFSFRFPRVPAGDYTLVVSEDDPTGGTEGTGPDSDTKEVSVG